jgi:hypothetical protein
MERARIAEESGREVALVIFPRAVPSGVVHSSGSDGMTVEEEASTQRWRLTWPTLRRREMTSWPM